MKQVFLKKGTAAIEEVPAQLVDDNSVKVEVMFSFISLGTELSGLSRTGQSLLKRAINQPANIKKFIDKSRTQGLLSTAEEVKSKGDQGITSGYSLSGRIIETGRNINKFKVGNIVACAGAKLATHSEIVVVPKNLVVNVPEGCSPKDSSSVAIGSIALQGVRRSGAKIGETIVVIGLGLIGQITAQLLKAAGCHVLGIDLDKRRVKLAINQGIDFGFNDSVETILQNISQITNGLGADATIICAASESNELVQQAMQMTRQKGKVVVVGAVGLGLQRKPFYEKEIDFLISCSYGPGRYDTNYELGGVDYPKAYVRWTENENMQAYLKMIATEQLNVDALIEKTYPLEQASMAYAELKNAKDKPLGVVLQYAKNESKAKNKLKTKIIVTPKKTNGKIGVAVVGVGSFATGTHLPIIKKHDKLFNLKALVSRTGATSNNVAKRFPAEYISTDYADILKDNEIEMVIICTRHNLHASMAIQALQAGKSVFIEKPMAMDQEELNKIISVHDSLSVKQPFMVGFNRRFSPAAIQAKTIIQTDNDPMVVLYRVKANPVPNDHWVQTQEGGGRVIGEACHMIDLFSFFTDSDIVSIDAESLTPNDTRLPVTDNFVTTLKYADGSVCTLIYTSQGSRKTRKERIEIFLKNQTIIIDDFKTLNILGTTEKKQPSKIQDKGHENELINFAQIVLNGGDLPIHFDKLVETTQITFKIAQMLKNDPIKR